MVDARPRETFLETRGVRLALTAWEAERDAVVVVAPGFFRSRASPMIREVQGRLAEHVDVVALDFRGHGASSGRFTFGRHEPGDLAAVLDHVRARGRPRLGLLGFSMGGYSSVVAIGRANREGRDPGVDALVTVSAPSRVVRLRPGRPPPGLLRTSWSEERERFPRLAVGAVLGAREEAVDLAEHVAPVPWAILHHPQDWLVPVRMAHELHERAREPKELRLLAGEGPHHADALVRWMPEAFFDSVLEFLDPHLRAGAPG